MCDFISLTLGWRYFSFKTTPGNSLPFCSAWIWAPCHFFAVLGFIFALAALEIMVSQSCQLWNSHEPLYPSSTNCRRNSNCPDVAAFGQVFAAAEVTEWIPVMFLLHVFTNKAFLAFYFTWTGSLGFVHPSLTFLSNYSIVSKAAASSALLSRPFRFSILDSSIPFGLGLLPSCEPIAWSPGAVEGAL